MVILNMPRSRLTRGQIGNFIGTVRIGDVDYYNREKWVDFWEKSIVINRNVTL
jgi:hypothetical protein